MVVDVRDQNPISVHNKPFLTLYADIRSRQLRLQKVVVSPTASEGQHHRSTPQTFHPVNFALVLFSTSGLAGDVNDRFDERKTVFPSENTSARSGLVLQEENAIISSSVAALDPPLQRPTSISTDDRVKFDIGSVSSLLTSSANIVVPSSTSQTSSFYSGACSKAAPCTGDITYYDTATTASNPSFCGTTNNGLTELVAALPHGIITDVDCGRIVTVTYQGKTKTGQVVDKCRVRQQLCRFVSGFLRSSGGIS